MFWCRAGRPVVAPANEAEWALDADDWLNKAKRLWQQANDVRELMVEMPGKLAERKAAFQRAVTSNSPDELRELADNPDPHLRRIVARNSSTPVDVLRHLAEPEVSRGEGRVDMGPPVRAGVAANAAVPQDLLNTLATDDDPRVRAAAAGNPEIPFDLLARLAEDRSEEVLAGVARNWNAPPDLLARLADGTRPDRRVATVLVNNPNLPESARERLKGDETHSRASGWRSAPFDVLKAGAGIVVARQLAKEEEEVHPDDPGIAVLGPLSWPVKRKALELARQGRTDAGAVDELSRQASGHQDALGHAALWLRCDGQASEQQIENLAHRLLLAAISKMPVEELSEPDRQLITELESVRALGRADAFAALVARQGELEALAEGFSPLAEPLPADFDVQPIRQGWIALSVPFMARAASRFPFIGQQVPQSLLDLIGRLEAFVGPTCGSNDPVLRSHTAINVSLEFCARKLYP